MVSVLPSSALADLFLLSYRLHHLPLCVPKLASVWLGVPGSEESPGIASRDFQFVFIILTPLPSLPPTTPYPRCAPGSPFSSGRARLPGFFRSVAATWSRVPRRRCRGLFPVARPARSCRSFQLTFRCQGLGWVGGWGGKGRERGSGGQEERVETEAAGLWDHFALTYIPSFCSEWLNMKTTQLLLTPALPPEHSNSN